MLTLVVGVGNAWRGDDGAGLEVARRVDELDPRLDVRTVDGDASALVDVWTGHDRVALVDAARSGRRPGTLHAFRADRAPLPAAALLASTHAFGVHDAIELGRALGRLPARLDVYAVEGADFTAGAPLSPHVARAVEALAAALCASGSHRPAFAWPTESGCGSPHFGP